MRVAIISDVHGNSIALDAVLEDVSQSGADQVWVLGDLVALGHDPGGALERLKSLPNASFIRGNTDRHVAEGPPYEEIRQAVEESPSRLHELLQAAAGFAWTSGALSTGGGLEWLASLPLDLRVVLPDGTRVLCVHASPGCDDGEGLHPEQSDARFSLLLRDANADLVFAAHTHWPLDRTSGSVRVVNVGSVSNPMVPDLRSTYVLLDADASGHRLEFRHVTYDLEAVLRALANSAFPSAEYVSGFMRGERTPWWMESNRP